MTNQRVCQGFMCYQEKEAKLRHHSDILQLQVDREAAERKKYQSEFQTLSEQLRSSQSDLWSSQSDLQMRNEALKGKEYECTQLRGQVEYLEMEKQQMNGELGTMGRSLEHR